jgi:hypothetical protein
VFFYWQRQLEKENNLKGFPIQPSIFSNVPSVDIHPSPGKGEVYSAHHVKRPGKSPMGYMISEVKNEPERVSFTMSCTIFAFMLKSFFEAINIDRIEKWAPPTFLRVKDISGEQGTHEE